MDNHTSMPYNMSVAFIESPLFSNRVYDYLSEDEYSALQWTLAVNPKTGKVIPGSGGLRKLRWSAKGHGKRGGARIIYYLQNKKQEIWLLTIYAKNEAESIPIKTLKAIRGALKDET